MWHATLNAFGGAFLFTMVTGDDKARLGLLLAGAYAVLALAVYLVAGRSRAGGRADVTGRPRETVGT